jgi:hypothetical protein
MRARSICMLGAVASMLFASTSAHAQLHWDASAQVGVMKRNLVNRPSGGKDAGFGPVGQLAGHIALFPLVRVGGYFGHDISPVGGDVSARDLTWGGLRAKIMSPWPRGSFRTWLFVGFGYEGVYARSSSIRGNLVHGAGGGFFEVPFGLGASYMFRKPFAISTELGMRAGFGHSGSMYEDPGPRLTVPGQPDGNALPAGIDRFAIGLTVGVMIDL